MTFFRMPKDVKQPPAQRAQAAKANKAEMTRRDLLRSGAAVATATLAPGVTLMAFGGSPAEAAAAPRSRTRMETTSARIEGPRFDSGDRPVILSVRSRWHQVNR